MTSIGTIPEVPEADVKKLNGQQRSSDSELEATRNSIAFMDLRDRNDKLVNSHSITVTTDDNDVIVKQMGANESDSDDLVDNDNIDNEEEDEIEENSDNISDNRDSVRKKLDKKLRRRRWKHKSQVDSLPKSDSEDGIPNSTAKFPSRLRHGLHKTRSRSEVVIPSLAMINNNSSSVDETISQVDNSNGVHSDTEIHVLIDDRDAEQNHSSIRQNLGPFKYFSSFGSDSGNQGAGESSASNFRRRISQLNPEALGSGISKNFKLNNLRMNFGRKKKVGPEEYIKSAELISELQSGVAAAIVLASQFQRDERNLRRVPVLLEQINVKITEITQSSSHSRSKYKIDLEYGSGPARLTWSVTKDYKDFTMLNTRLKASNFQPMSLSYKGNLPKLPRRHAIGSGRQKSVSGASEHDTNDEGRTGRHLEPLSSNTSVDSIRSQSSSQHHIIPLHHNLNLTSELEDYLKRLLQQLKFGTDANKLFQFLELSNMSIRLAPESSYHGKEGQLFIRSTAVSQGWRVSHWRPNDFSQMIQRHTHKWFLVRHSYILCVENITSTNVLEVFLVDPGFKVSTQAITGDIEDGVQQQTSKGAPQFFLQVENLERKLKMASKSERAIAAWAESISFMKQRTIWAQPHRFDSFAPVRHNVYTQWFVDGRDYFWAVSEAIDKARDVIYIHDWWLSPELYLRRPPQGNQQWRLDRLLKRKAEQGVKIFIVIYRNVGQFIPIDSLYTKHSLLDLHENIFVMRSPNQWIQNTYFWAHHEKICMIDHTIAFLGGIDLCFGRWDSPEHILTDDKPKAFFTAADESPYEETQNWPGKDYSNPRVLDFQALDQPFEDLYDRKQVPRMPWHDIHMLVTGHTARDLCRHFVQRWNYLIRQKRTSRYTPFLLPPPDFTEQAIEQGGFHGTCEIQVLRSSGVWSLGLKEPEHSIQNAYLKAIETSEHFIYIENQFFITSTTLDGTMIENKIGDALFERIVRAHKNEELWKAVILIPLMPGFESEVDSPDASSVRLIMQCQYVSISRGKTSLFARLHYAGIQPEEYIQFFSLRKWAKIGPNKKLITEQLYIHAKTMIVDDRVAIIGSANINERSMRGSRDSEIAAFIRDTHQIPSKMGGEPYMVGKFTHSLRVRLMREHLGIDVDKLDVVERNVEALINGAVDPNNHNVNISTDAGIVNDDSNLELHSFNFMAGMENKGLREKKTLSSDSRVQNNSKHAADVAGTGFDAMSDMEKVKERREQYEKYHQNKQASLSKDTESIDKIIDDVLSEDSISDLETFKRSLYNKLASENEVSRSENPSKLMSRTSSMNNLSSYNSMTFGPDNFNKITGPPSIDPFGFDDPLDETFYYDIWLSTARRNTSIFREVFRCQPDDEVTTWKEYKEYVAFGERFSAMQDNLSDISTVEPEETTTNGSIRNPVSLRQRESKSTMMQEKNLDDDDLLDVINSHDKKSETPKKSETKSDHINFRRRRANTRTSRRFFSNSIEQVYDRTTALKILDNVQGNLVIFPTEWLSRELETYVFQS